MAKRKFRVWADNYKCFLYWDDQKEIFHGIAPNVSHPGNADIWIKWKDAQKEDAIEEWLGINDLEGNPIYAGDIAERPSSFSNNKEYWVYKVDMPYVFRELLNGHKRGFTMLCCDDDSLCSKIVGHIHDGRDYA